MEFQAIDRLNQVHPLHPVCRTLTHGLRGTNRLHVHHPTAVGHQRDHDSLLALIAKLHPIAPRLSHSSVKWRGGIARGSDFVETFKPKE